MPNTPQELKIKKNDSLNKNKQLLRFALKFKLRKGKLAGKNAITFQQNKVESERAGKSHYFVV